MSLVVSLRVPDGIVVAADSLSTAQNLLEFATGELELKCPGCGAKVTGAGLKVPPFPIPFHASSYTQKLFALWNKYAVSSYGLGVINQRSIYHHVKQFERSRGVPSSLEEARDAFVAHMEAELLRQFPKYREEAPEEWKPLAFHINGFETVDDEPSGVTYEIFVGRENIERKREKIGCTIGGDMKVVHKLWEIGRDDPRLQVRYDLFSLQDAIDLCEFYIGATCTFQRFANEVATVGGQTDIALLTLAKGFQWIKRKSLMDVLEGDG